MYLDLRGKKVRFEVVPSTFERYFSLDEEKELVSELYNGYTFNGGTARLESLDDSEGKCTIRLATSNFYNLLTTTLLANRVNVPDKVKEFQDSIKKRGALDELQGVIHNKLLSNDIAVSVMIKDVNGDYILARRGAKVSVGTTLLSTSVTGSMDAEDIINENPVEFTVKREMYEEVHIDEDDIDVTVEGLYIGEDKLQPVFICNVTYDGVFDDEWLDNSIGYSTENTYFNRLTLDELKRYSVAKGRLSEAGVYHINLITSGN